MKGLVIAALTALSLTLSACGNEPSYAETLDEEEQARSLDDDTPYETATEDLSDRTFQDVGDTSLCTEDCSGHDAGFEWAKENDITDPNDCGGTSQSFIEGCEAYGESLEERADEYTSDTDY